MFHELPNSASSRGNHPVRGTLCTSGDIFGTTVPPVQRRTRVLSLYDTVQIYRITSISSSAELMRLIHWSRCSESAGFNRYSEESTRRSRNLQSMELQHKLARAQCIRAVRSSSGGDLAALIFLIYTLSYLCFIRILYATFYSIIGRYLKG